MTGGGNLGGVLRLAQAVLAVVLASGCVREAESVPITAHEPGGPALAVAADVKLELSAAARVAVGEDLSLTLRVRNASDRALTLVRPIYGSWELARDPRYELVWTDEQGQPILDPLGFAPGLECGTLDQVTRGDLVRVEPGATAALPNGPSARTSHVVLASARPGRYSLQVRYLAQGIEGATDLAILSEPVEVEIVGGDAAMWSCRAEQVAAAANHEWVSVSPAGVVATEGGFWLVFSGYRHRVVEHEKKSGGEVWMQRLGADLSTAGDPQLIRRADEELGFISVAEHDGELLLVATPGPVGGRRIEAWSVALDGGAPVAGEPKLVQASPGNPYVTRAVARGDRVAILHEGADADDGGLRLSFVDRSGSPLGRARKLASTVTDFELLAVDNGELAAIWLERGDVEGGVLARFDQVGDPIEPAIRFALDPSYSVIGAHLDIPIVDPNADRKDVELPTFELAWVDSSAAGDNRADVMGLYAGRFSAVDGQPLKPARALSFESRTDARFGEVAWHGEALGVVELQGAIVDFGIGKLRSARLSSTAGGTVRLFVIPDGFVALWTDRRNDESKACATLNDCVPEIYGARFNPGGGTRAVARRLTTLARPKPFVPSAFDWQTHCP